MTNKCCIDFNALRDYTSNDIEMQKELIKTFKSEIRVFRDGIVKGISEVNKDEIKDISHRLIANIKLFGLGYLEDKLQSIINNFQQKNNIDKNIDAFFEELNEGLSKLEKSITSE